MFGTLGRRVAEGLVGLFAILGFAFVPLGSRTGLEHSIAVFGSPTAREAATGLLGAFDRARTALVRALVPATPETTPPSLPPHGVRPVVPALPKPSAKSAPTSAPAGAR